MVESSSNVNSSNSVADPQDQRVPLRTKFFFGVGRIGETASNWIFLSHLEIPATPTSRVLLDPYRIYAPNLRSIRWLLGVINSQSASP